MSAREQLLGAVASLREQGPLRIDVLKHRSTPRESAVLILVGVLDDVAGLFELLLQRPPLPATSMTSVDSGVSSPSPARGSAETLMNGVKKKGGRELSRSR